MAPDFLSGITKATPQLSGIIPPKVTYQPRESNQDLSVKKH